MNQLTAFNFHTNNVRVVHQDGDPWFVAQDILAALDYAPTSKPSRVTSHVPELWRGVHPIHTPSGVQDMAVLSEAGMFFFLNRSDKPKALPFQMWLAGDVLPAIRKTGGYQVPEPPLVRPGQVEALRRERGLPATLTPEQYEAERERLESMQARLSATPIVIAPEEYERLTAQRLLVGKKTYLVTELIGILEHYGIPREVAENITGHNRNTIRQHALLSRRRKGGAA